MLRWAKEHIQLYFLKIKFPKVKLYYGVCIDNKSILGKYCVVFPNTTLVNTKLGDYSYVQKNSEIVNTSIGKFCSIARNVSIGLANHPINFISTSPVFYDASQALPSFFTDKVHLNTHALETQLCSDVWVGQGAMIKEGVTIGVGAIVGAGAVVTKNVEPYSIVAGIPAKHIKYRFDEETRIELLKSKWWEYDDAQLVGLSEYFHNPTKFCEKLQKAQ